MASKSPSRHRKTVDWKTSSQLKTLENEQADLLKLFSSHLNELEGYLTQNKTMNAKSAYRGFVETYDNLEANKRQKMLLLKPKYRESFDNDTKRMLEEKSKVLRWVVDKVPFLRVIEILRTEFFSYWKDIFRGYKSVKSACPILSEPTNLEKKLKTENSSDSEKQTLCNQVEQLVEKLDEIYAEPICTMKQDYSCRELVIFSNFGSHYRDLIKENGQSKDCGNQTSLTSSTSAVDKDPNETVIYTGIGATEHAEENIEVFSRHSASLGSRKQPSIVKSRSSRRRLIDEMELEHLRAKKETEQKPQERQLELEQEPEEIQLRRQQQEDELRLLHKREPENERKKAEANEEQRIFSSQKEVREHLVLMQTT